MTDVRPVPVSAHAKDVPGNDELRPVPVPGSPRASVPYDLPGLRVGTAEYAEGPTGCTVLYLPEGARTYVDRRGGAVGVSGGYELNHAICLAGGSVYGLAAAAGVTAELLARRRNVTRWDELALVSGAVIYDLSVRDNAVVPDMRLGAAALDNAQTGGFPVGRVGAGIGASVGKADPKRAEFAGQGAAFGTYGEAKVLVATVVNAVGAVVGRDGTVVRGNHHEATGERRHLALDYADQLAQGSPAVPGNTTLTVLVTNVRLTDRELEQTARQVHTSMARGIQPFHTMNDGDVLFALTTDEVALPGTGPSGLPTPTPLATLASDLAWDAVLSAVR